MVFFAAGAFRTGGPGGVGGSGTGGDGGATGGAVDAYRVRSFPGVFVLDAMGVIRHKHLRGSELEKAVEKLLAETGK